ncbi:hypothetical protein F4604DRAFT_1769173 [Suillus subluteus]|nr:hypothetical protein F4604DRAFT_1769173 [Suillus subluteus]
MSLGWEIHMSNSKGIPYYFNAVSKQSSWDAPSELSKDQIKSPPGSKYLIASSSRSARTITANNLLMKCKDSWQPLSWKETNITCTKEEAINILQEYQAQVGNFIHSNCSLHSQKGNLRPFSKEFSDIISTESSVHIILRTA